MQLKQWGAAVRTWSGALAVAPAHMQAELYRNRAFAQSERGYLAMACEDMAAALARYTSLQQRRRCQEKLDRWTSRLQGTEQAYLRQQQQLAGESYDDGGGGGAGGDDPSVSYTHRRKIKQLAGLIQGEWEEWHGEDYDESNSDDDDAEGAGSSRRSRRQRQRRRGRAASRGGSTTRGNGGRSGARLDMAKQSRMAPSLTGPFSPSHTGASLTPRPPPSSLINNGREAPPLGDASSSAHIKRMIASLGLDVPWQEKLAIEAAKDRAKRRDARRARRAQRKHDRALSVTIEEGEEEAKQQQQQPQQSDEDSLSDSTTSSDSEAEPVPDPSADQSLMHSPASPAAAAAAVSSSSSTQGRLGHSMSSSSLVSSDPDPDALLADLYADDSVDPYASLSKLFIRLRIDSKYLWRFETASIHLANIHTVSEAEMKRVLPPLGPRLTLINFLQDRIVLMRQKEGIAEGGGAAAGAASAAASSAAAASPASPSFSSSSSVAAAAAFASRSDRDHAGRDALWSLESTQAASSVPLDETAAIAARIQHGRGRSSLSFPYLATPGSPLAAGNGAAAAAKPLPPPLNPINPSPIVPVSPHNAYPVNRPLSARDRRVLYDAKKHARSAMSPIRTYGATNWK